jgi:hypothetical protein
MAETAGCASTSSWVARAARSIPPETSMEHLWSQAVATDGNPWQMGWSRKRLKQAKTVAVGCDQLP